MSKDWHVARFNALVPSDCLKLFLSSFSEGSRDDLSRWRIAPAGTEPVVLFAIDGSSMHHRGEADELEVFLELVVGGLERDEDGIALERREHFDESINEDKAESMA
jgi:hypothetical protein